MDKSSISDATHNSRRAISMLNIVIIMLFTMILPACGNAEKTVDPDTMELPISTYMADESSIDDVCAAVHGAGLDADGKFETWVREYAEIACAKSDIPKTWRQASEFPSEDIYTCVTNWESKSDYLDADCRMTAMTIMGDKISAGNYDDADTSGEMSELPEYKGTYLMFDLDAIDTVPKYDHLAEKRALFTSLFGEMPVPDGEDGLRTALAEQWARYGIKFDSDKASLISVVIEDPNTGQAFVGHTGILIDLTEQGGYYLFVEKLAFSQPYQATRVNNIDELLEMFKNRPEYLAEENARKTTVYKNDNYIGELG